MGQAVQDQSVKPWVAGEHLPAALGSRIALKNGLDIGSQSCEHGLRVYLFSRSTSAHVLSNTSEDMDFFLGELCAVKELLQSGDEFFGRQGIQKTNLNQGLFPVL
jgi:hypothetical protein